METPILQHEVSMHDHDSMRAVAVPLQHRATLELLARTSVPPDTIPSVWPLTRADVSAIIAGLEGAGAVRRRWDGLVPGRTVLALTGAGRRMLAALDDAAMRAAVADAEGHSPRVLSSP
jgi:DNA-binding MarR family transcriptional regulator